MSVAAGRLGGGVSVGRIGDPSATHPYADIQSSAVFFLDAIMGPGFTDSGAALLVPDGGAVETIRSLGGVSRTLNAWNNASYRPIWSRSHGSGNNRPAWDFNNVNRMIWDGSDVLSGEFVMQWVGFAKAENFSPLNQFGRIINLATEDPSGTEQYWGSNDPARLLVNGVGQWNIPGGVQPVSPAVWTVVYTAAARTAYINGVQLSQIVLDGYTSRSIDRLVLNSATGLDQPIPSWQGNPAKGMVLQSLGVFPGSLAPTVIARQVALMNYWGIVA